MRDTIKIMTEIVFFLRDHYGTQCSDGGERLQVTIQSTAGDYTLAEVRNSILKKFHIMKMIDVFYNDLKR